MRRFRVGLGQINPTVGDFEGNVQKIVEAIERARALGCQLVAFPELAVPGYPPEDLLFKPAFIEANRKALDVVTRASRGLTVVVGFVDKRDDIFNAAAILHDGACAGVYHKQYLPNYGVFDENRYFQAGTEAPVFAVGETVFAVNVCEDIWYPAGPTTAQALAGAELVVNVNGSPYHAGKARFREQMVATRAADDLVCVAYVNMVGGQDELVFDGASLIVNEHGQCVARGRQFEEDFVVADLDLEAVFHARLHDPRRRKEKLRAGEAAPRIVLPALPAAAQVPPVEPPTVAPLERVEEVFRALVLGTRDYVRKNGFARVVIGLSGGIDSSLVAAIAVEALGRENVAGVGMPSPYSSAGTRRDAQRVAKNLGIEYLSIPITPILRAYKRALARAFKGLKEDVTEENLQARIRGNLLMALSNKFGWLVLTTGNKSEYSVGYTTLYGDMAGGFAVIKDVPKMLVYEVARHVNASAGRALIPATVFERAPSAELRPSQTDQDTLPPYAELDAILEGYVEEDRGVNDLVARGFAPETVRRVVAMVDRNEYKRRQAPIGVKITPRAFGRDWRLPIVNRFREQ
ncbi:MAG: NAD+ synthase [Candidatus Rokubacteria bacterium 13_1_40CM_4_69_39]|jgi:NAD+ synthase (glutamine-hydrolysing)|nr:MAG: NAD+ synthase [Candidatus Rokubacteria bacterium 13_1_40CM_69_96]OLC52693.1 MAG: NAD+ synthase [Candidatus Rokubacteria bacterium 13_1_40CM_4_69_39]OLD30543.1 MAG: NAD+ synthase [Candidatus Rokubacteria bacterium 13_1_40CM_2_70_45]OLD77211.1 MAG: NAD+ synthase [Candidatus Rokubacteria bacterium 13_1_20CM_4_70_14]OLE50312.1 MAG: NAD+ synthase [Candidatus Rokubacteria bacterium 13_1_20CM_2_69_58]PYM50283.1 MAG: NAD+ synthase [Candidatus Rokubacteria bacterium]